MKSILYQLTENIVEDIPSGLLTCLADGKQMRIQACAPEYASLVSADRIPQVCTKLTFAYYNGQTGNYQAVDIEEIAAIQEKEITFSSLRGEEIKAYETVYHIENAAYSKMFQFVTKQYYDYIMLKSESIDNDFSQVLTGYPAEEDDTFTSDYETWKRKRLERVEVQQMLSVIRGCGVELVHCLDNDIAYRRYLSGLWDSSTYDTCVINATRLYIGNQFCHNLFPESKTLYELLDKARKEGLAVTLVLPYLRESLRKQTFTELEKIDSWCQKWNFPIEVIINDWGMCSFLKEKADYMTPVLGFLLNKRRKDPRYQYKTGFAQHQEQLAENQMNQLLFGQLLQQLGIRRIEYESCGYPMKLARIGNSPGDNIKISLHLPLYQTNTSQFCTLYALCRNKDRSAQELVMKCPKYCQSYICAYPEHLDMIGHYNSLFALDNWLLTHPEELIRYCREGVDRIVWNLS